MILINKEINILIYICGSAKLINVFSIKNDFRMSIKNDFK